MIPDLERLASVFLAMAALPPNPTYDAAIKRVTLSQARLAEIDRKRKVREMRRRCGGTFPREREGWQFDRQPVVLNAWLEQRKAAPCA